MPRSLCHLPHLVLALIMSVVSTASFGADIATGLPVKAPAPAASHTWTGPYAGLNAGYGWTSSSTDLTAVDDIIFTLAQQTFGALPKSLSPRANGFIGGAQIGYNWQINRSVFGLEADFSFAGMRGSSALATSVMPFPAMTTTQENRINWFGTVRPRAGLLLTPDVLGYVTGGLAYGGVKASTGVDVDPAGTCPATNGFCAAGSASKTRVGWTVGLGAEVAFASRWAAKAEYLYFDLGTLSYPVISTATFGIGGTEAMRAEAKFKSQIVRVGLNYRLN